MRPLLVALALIISCFSFAQQKQSHNSFVRPLPKPAKAVNDFSKLLTASEKQYLEKELVRYHRASSNAIVIITLDSLTDPKTEKQYTVEEAALLYFNTWGIGDRTKNNGVLLMATRKPRKLRIEVGKGLEGILTDDVCQQIMDEKLIPHFKQGLFFTGFKEAISALEQKLDNGVSAAAINDNSANDASQQPVSYTVENDGGHQGSSGFSMLSVGVPLFIILVVGLIIFNIIRSAAGVFTGNGYRHHRSGFGNGYNNNYHRFNNNQATFNDDAYIASGAGMSSSFDSSPSSSSDSSSSSSSSFSGGSSDGGGASGSW